MVHKTVNGKRMLIRIVAMSTKLGRREFGVTEDSPPYGENDCDNDYDNEYNNKTTTWTADASAHGSGGGALSNVRPAETMMKEAGSLSLRG